MYLTLLYWALLFLPGFVVVRRFWPSEFHAGFPGVTALAYLATFALLSPVGILGYIFRWPLPVLSVSCIVSVALALIEITRCRWWPELARLMCGAISLELGILALDALLGALNGSYLWGDAQLHLARVRFLLDNGLTNQDPFVTQNYFYPIYHTNILHALYASCAQITGIDHFDVWFATLPWAKLLIASGAYYLVWAAFERKWPAWTAAVFTIGAWGPATFVLYPNKLAPLWMLPCLLAFGMRLCQPDAKWRDVVRIGLAVLVIAQTHGLYSAVAVMTLAPVISIFTIVSVLRRQISWRKLLVTLFALCISLSFVYTSYATTRGASANKLSSPPLPGAQTNTALLVVGDDSIMLAPSRALGANSAALMVLLGIGILGSMFTERRRSLVIQFGFVVVISLFLFAPPLCTLLYAILREGWMIERCAAPLRLSLLIFVPGLTAYAVSTRWKTWWLRVLLTLAFGLAGAMCFARTGLYLIDKHRVNELTWPTYANRALRSADSRRADLILFRDVATFLRAHIPSGSTILTPPDSIGFVALHDCYVVAPEKGSVGIMDIRQRRIDLRRMRRPNTPWPQKLALLKQYNITHVVAPGPQYPLLRWARRHASNYVQSPRGTVVVTLNLTE